MYIAYQLYPSEFARETDSKRFIPRDWLTYFQGQANKLKTQARFDAVVLRQNFFLSRKPHFYSLKAFN
jgi:hypothetical protein